MKKEIKSIDTAIKYFTRRGQRAIIIYRNSGEKAWRCWTSRDLLDSGYEVKAKTILEALLKKIYREKNLKMKYKKILKAALSIK